MILNAYYFRHHMYSLVPRHVREDMRWMADIGTTVVSIAVLEQDLYASRYNMEIICREAERVGMKVHAVPSRWGGLVAGAPKVPSHFTATHPETWVLKRDGSPVYQGPQGPLSSIYHPATFEFFRKNLEILLREFSIHGITWDEPKSVGMEDFSAAAKAAGADNLSWERRVDHSAEFFDRLNKHCRGFRKDVKLSLFLYAHTEGYPAERLARIQELDYFGCDGRPWRIEDGGQLESAGKVLLGQAERFMAAARRNGKGGLILIENHNMPGDCDVLMDKRMPEVLNLGAEIIIYYYYPRNIEDPDRQMSILAKHLKPVFKS